MYLRALAAVFVTVAALAAAGCGSDDNSSSTGASTDSASTSASKTPSGTPINVGSICSCSGGQAEALGRAKDVMQAWANTVNDAGGINGHPIKLFVEDDGGEAAKSLKAAKQLVEQDKVVAIVGITSSTADAWQKYVEGKGVPVLGGNSFLAPFAASAEFFPTGPPLPVELLGIAKLAKAAGKQHLGAVYCAEVPVCAQLGALIGAEGKIVGLDVTTGKAAVAQPNFTALCLSLDQAGADALAVAQSAPTVARVHKSCAQQGYKPLPLNYTSGSTPSWYTDPNLNNMKLVGSLANYTDESLPEVQRFNAALDKYAPGLRDSAQFAFSGSWEPWSGGVLFEKAAEAAKLTPTSTPDDVKKGLYALSKETLGGMAQPLTFTEGKPTFNPCYFEQEIKDGTLETTKAEPTCLSADELGALTKILAG